MVQKTSENYLFHFYDTYVIAEAIEGAVINTEVIKETLQTIFDHFDGKEFTIITNRKNRYTVQIDVYAAELMKKVQAIAVVSDDAVVKEKAFAEQLKFNQSFAFFENLKDAVSWAEGRGNNQLL